MDKWECEICGYIYDPEAGDPDRGVMLGMPFEALPDDWVCPICGASKDVFKIKIREAINNEAHIYFCDFCGTF